MSKITLLKHQSWISIFEISYSQVSCGQDQSMKQHEMGIFESEEETIKIMFCYIISHIFNGSEKL
jgi:hypothetical protein